jgi:DNA-binding response OmpR family regulator
MPATDSKKQILIVDQDVAAVEPLRQRLCDAGFIARVIADGAAAVTALAQRPPHLVIIDWNAPGFAALEVMALAHRMREPHRVRLILLSALSSEPDVVSSLGSELR